MFTLPWSQISAEIVWMIGAGAFMSIRLGPQLRAKREPIKLSRRPATDFVLVSLNELCFGVLPFAYIFFKIPEFAGYPWFPPMLIIGALVFALAIWANWRAHKDLGRSFSATLEIRPDHALVTTGIYRHIRHPIYAAFLLWGIAQALLLPNWVVGFSAPVAFAMLVVSRISREERMMIDTFGDRYRHYMTETARLIPGVL